MEEDDGTRRPPCPLPERVFAVGEEPTGVRVTPYHKAGAIRKILNALEPDELEHIRVSPFGKFIEIADKPSFSGRFGRYILSRQLKVAKKHEAWFLFAGKPIRFSIREFALVTGLNCSKFPRRSKKKSKDPMTEKPYWGELFGSLKEVPVSSVIRMLEKKTVADREIRLKYAYLSLLAAVILPTTHSPRISQVFAEIIKDFDAFFAYPWGRVSFDMLMSSIKERKEVSLSQNTIALKGFVLALQLVIVECIPALTEVVQDGSSSDGETGVDDDCPQTDNAGRKGISPGHARDTDAAEKALVESIMLDGNGETSLAPEYQWSDDEEDVLVSNMLNLIDEGFGFTSSCFLGGATKQDVCRMREVSKAELVNRKTVKSKNGTSSQVQDGLDIDLLASIVREKLKDDFQLLHGSIATIQEAANGFTETILVNVNDVFGIVQDCVKQLATISQDLHKLGTAAPVSHVETAKRRANVVDAGTQTIPDPTSIISDAIHFANQSSDPTPDIESNPKTDATGPTGNGNQETVQGGQTSAQCLQDEHLYPPPLDSQMDSGLDPAMLFPNPTFSLGLTQEGRMDPANNVNATVDSEHEVSDEPDVEDSREEVGAGFRTSKRQKVPTKSLMGEYECDKGFLNRARKAVADAIYKGGNIDYPAKFAVLLEKLKTPFEITTERGNIQSTDLYEVAQRETQLPTKVVDVLVFHTTTLFRSQSHSSQQPSPAVFMDTQFVSQFTKLYTKFSKSSKKDTYKFNGDVVDLFLRLPSNADAVRFYFPFYLDKKYWVAICVDCSSWSVTILDCNISLRTDFMMNKELGPFAMMFPYFLKQVGRKVGMRECKAMAIERPRSIQQQKEVTNSAVSSLLFIQAHAVGGLDACKCITPDVLGSYVERLLVSLYEASVGPL